MRKHDNADATAETTPSSEYPMQAWDEPTVGLHKPFGKVPLAAALVGAASACAVLGVVIFAYTNLTQPKSVAVAPGALAGPATPAAPAVHPPAANAPAPAAANTAPHSGTNANTASAATGSNPGAAPVVSAPASPPAPVTVAPRPQAVDEATPPDSGPAEADPAAPPAAPAGPVVIVSVPPLLPPLPTLPPPPSPPSLPTPPPPPACDPPHHLVGVLCI